MGTRATYRFTETYRYDDKDGIEKRGNNHYGLIYTQYDGYPEGVPMGIMEFIAAGKVVNGLGVGDNGLVFNGMGCLMAQVISEFKDGPGYLYMSPLSHRGKSGENYLYDIILGDDREITIEVRENYGRKPKIFSGSLTQYIENFKQKENA